MDDKWFKAKQKKAGVTAEDIAKKMGRARSNVSHIYSGQQRMSLDWAKAFAEVLDEPLDEILKRAGAINEVEAQTLTIGFAEGDAAPWVHKGPEDRKARSTAETLGGERPGIDVWVAKSDVLLMDGYRSGDFLLVDTHQADRVAPGDAVIAQVYDGPTGTATTILRRFEPPVLVASSPQRKDNKIHVVDGSNVVVRGKVIASWRA